MPVCFARHTHSPQTTSRTADRHVCPTARQSTKHTMSSAILLIAHGSRRAAANADLVQLAETVRTRCPDDIVEIAYLELTEPTIPQGAARCVERGATDVRMSPFFLSAGTHIAEDLTGFQAEFATQFPGVRFQLCPPLGLHPLLVEALLERMDEVWSAEVASPST